MLSADALPCLQAASGCLFTDGAGQVLLVNPTYKPKWEIPGGIVELGESPLAACRREVAEELGLDVRPTRLLAVDYQQPALGRVRGGLRFVFDGGVLTPGEIAAIRLCPDELSEFGFVAPGDLGDYLTPRLARRVRACLATPAGGCYLEDGRHVLLP